MTDIDTVVTPDDIDVGFVPRLSQDLVALDVGAETVLLGNFGQALVLNPTAGLVWRFLDGETALGELIDDFSDVLDVDADTVRTDVVDFARALGRTGLLEGVVEPIDPDDLIEIDWSPPVPVAVGDVLEPVALTDLDGAPATLETGRGRRVFLVNWSPGCGFCVTTAAALAAAEEGLAAAGIDLVLLTNGDADENRRVLDEAGLGAPALLRSDDGDPFAGFGTPAAYLLDADGRVEEPMAYGADEVPARAAELAGIERPGSTHAVTTDADSIESATTGRRGALLPGSQRRLRPRRAGAGRARRSGRAPRPIGSATSTSGSATTTRRRPRWSTGCCPGPGCRTPGSRTTSRSPSTRAPPVAPVGSTCSYRAGASSSGAGRRHGPWPPC